MAKIRIGILGYGNLGKGVELAVRQNPDMELAAFFTRRAPESLKTQSPEVPVYNIKDILDKKDDIDVMILCGGSATDLPVQSPEYAKYFNIVDSFDTHAKIPEHFANVDASAKEGGKVAFISVGWDPGMFSLNILGQRCFSGSFRCHQKNRRRSGCKTVHSSRGCGSGKSQSRRKP